MSITIVLDLEGVLTPPGTDYAKTISENCGPEASKLVEIFDMYDDYRWIKERLGKGGKYQTGTTPFFSLLVAYAYGLSQNDIEQIASELADTCVHEEYVSLVDELSRRYSIAVATSSYHVFSERVAYLLGIDTGKVFSTCNTKIDGVYGENVYEILESISSRSEIKRIVNDISSIAREILRDRVPLYSIDNYIEKIGNRELRDYLRARLRDQIGIAGSKFKARVVKMFKENGNVIYIGDSIVDSEACVEANASISINTTSPHLLYSSTINIVTEDYKTIIDAVEILLSILGVRRRPIERKKYRKFLLFFSSDIVKNFSLILEINKKIREKAKEKLRVDKPRLPRDIFVLENL